MASASARLLCAARSWCSTSSCVKCKLRCTRFPSAFTCSRVASSRACALSICEEDTADASCEETIWDIICAMASLCASTFSSNARPSCKPIAISKPSMAGVPLGDIFPKGKPTRSRAANQKSCVCASSVARARRLLGLAIGRVMAACRSSAACRERVSPTTKRLALTRAKLEGCPVVLPGTPYTLAPL